ncbi:MAG: hypothetical protein LBF89_06345 [Bacteroidales bacterium]|jgi:hypothetical protein|nr:hypothetical protein [Bacteroidales bacterium]
MTQQETVKLFETKRIRTAWNKEERYLSVAIPVAVFTDRPDPADDLKKTVNGIRYPEIAQGQTVACAEFRKPFAAIINYVSR